MPNSLYLYANNQPRKSLPAIVPQWTTAPASSTRTTRPRVSAYDILSGSGASQVPVFRPAPKPKLTFGQLLESIKNMDGLVFLPQWRNYMNRERALELSRVLRDYGGYNGLEWSLTSGFANPKLAALIRLRYPDYPLKFAKDGDILFKGVLIPGANIGLDVPHFNASLSKYLDNDTYRRNIPADWAGWAGDMFTFVS